jgi:hypothetical protein
MRRKRNYYINHNCSQYNNCLERDGFIIALSLYFLELKPKKQK